MSLSCLEPSSSFLGWAFAVIASDNMQPATRPNRTHVKRLMDTSSPREFGTTTACRHVKEITHIAALCWYAFPPRQALECFQVLLARALDDIGRQLGGR